MIADLLTKALPRETVDQLRQMMGVVGEPSREELQ